MACERGSIGDKAPKTDGQGGRGGTYPLREAPLESSLRRGEAAVELVRAPQTGEARSEPPARAHYSTLCQKCLRAGALTGCRTRSEGGHLGHKVSSARRGSRAHDGDAGRGGLADKTRTMDAGHDVGRERRNAVAVPALRRDEGQPGSPATRAGDVPGGERRAFRITGARGCWVVSELCERTALVVRAALFAASIKPTGV
jgi:hypothetical protein